MNEAPGTLTRKMSVYETAEKTVRDCVLRVRKVSKRARIVGISYVHVFTAFPSLYCSFSGLGTR